MELRVLAVVLLIACANARLLGENGALPMPSGRSLQQVAFCPDGCLPGYCIQDATMAGLRCQKCAANLIVSKVTGQCACPAGRYSPNGSPNCVDCPKSSFCLGDIYKVSAFPQAIACPANMTTLGLRSVSNRACVNLPGFYYDLTDGIPSAVECPVNTYGPGLKKQRACVPCPTGFTTNGKVGQIRPDSCIVPAGYYLKAPGQIAPCPKGEWKAGIGTSGNCTKCAFGVTTAQEASTSASECKLLVPGWYAAAVGADSIVTSTKVCPQKFYCPGGQPLSAFNASNPGALSASDPTIKVCPKGLWTVDVGSIAIEQCLTPPGFYTNATSTVQCPIGSYRADWKADGQATGCNSCGDGVLSEQTDSVTVYDTVTGAQTKLAVTSSADDCYIQPGQGLYYNTLTQSWRARNCLGNSYGVSNRTYGLTPAACRDCPSGQVASANATSNPTSAAFLVTNPDGSGGFVSVKACVNMPGYGYNGRVSQKCGMGTYNPGDNYGDCLNCAYGLTTRDIGVGVSEGDCGMAAGFGLVNGTIRPCPIGTFNNVSWTASTTLACTACPFATTTDKEGGDAADSCNLCVAGYGGVGCQTQCGGVGASATYGIPGREVNSVCAPCTTATTGFSFEWMMSNDVYAPQSISRPGASASTDCLSQFAQINDKSWYIPLSNWNFVSNVSSPNFADCVSRCVEPCQLVTYDYRRQICSIRNSQPPVLIGSTLVGYKAMPSGDVGVNAWSLTDSTAQAKAIASGQYSFYRDPNADALPVVPAPNASTFKTLQDCLNACDDDALCAGITIDMYIAVSGRPASCQFIKGNSQLGQFYRTMTRVEISRLPLPDLTQ